MDTPAHLARARHIPIRPPLAAVLRGLRRRQLFETQPARLGWYLLLSTIPAAVAGILLKGVVEKAFANPMMTAFALFGTSILLIIAERIGKRSAVRRDGQIDQLRTVVGILPVRRNQNIDDLAPMAELAEDAGQIRKYGRT